MGCNRRGNSPAKQGDRGRTTANNIEHQCQAYNGGDHGSKRLGSRAAPDSNRAGATSKSPARSPVRAPLAQFASFNFLNPLISQAVSRSGCLRRSRDAARSVHHVRCPRHCGKDLPVLSFTVSVKGFGCRPRRGRAMGYGGRRPKGSKGGNRDGGTFAVLRLWGFDWRACGIGLATRCWLAAMTTAVMRHR
jgi:hypothetical protein